MNKKITSTIIMASIVMTLGNPIFADTKEENIYANLDSNGNIKNVYVVNSFILEEDGKISDYGNYTDLRNLSGSEKIISDGDLINIDGKAGKNFYQGTMNNANLPWKINVKYYIDGKEMRADELSDKSGELEIKISIKKNEDAESTFFENYLLQTSLSLDTEKCKNIQAEGATIANVGSSKQLTYNVLAGSEKDIDIKADVTNFELPDGISFNGLLMSIAIDNFDTSVIEDKVALLKSGVSKLNNGTSNLKNGSSKYNNAISEFASRTKDLPSQSKQVQNGINKALEGVKTIEKNISSINSSSNNQIQQTVKNTASKEAKTQIQEQITKEITQLKQSEWYINLEPSEQVQIVNTIKEVATNVGTMTANNVATSTADIVSKAYESNMKNAIGELQTGLKNLESGLETLSKEYSKMDTGLNQISSASNSLSSSYIELNKGITEISNGIKKLNDKTQTLDTNVDEEIEKILQKFENTNYTPISFTSPENKDIKAVQFVIKTEGISIKEESKEQTTQKEELNFWQKFAKLFQKD